MDFTLYLKAILGLAIVLGLILGLSAGLKRLGIGDGLRGPLGRKRRLATVEAVMIDGRHKAVLLRRDDVEHLVLIGPNTSQVIEQGIPAPPAAPATQAETSPNGSTAHQTGNETGASRFSQWMK
ncbi:MAG: flagellar biosynthetic protein FliO [Proteobacteria bacterium]|nr:flagellar biosynthetic protein FliO [Pseudomonadota bacterium]